MTSQGTPRSLNGRELELLREAVLLRAPQLAPLIDMVGRESLSPEDRRALQGVVADELAASRLDSQDNHTERGIELDDLIGAIGRL